jgi:hypothetical protein
MGFQPSRSRVRRRKHVTLEKGWFQSFTPYSWLHGHRTGFSITTDSNNHKYHSKNHSLRGVVLISKSFIGDQRFSWTISLDDLQLFIFKFDGCLSGYALIMNILY